VKICPECGSTNCVKNGSIHNGTPKNQCNDCGRQFVDNPKNAPISKETKNLGSPVKVVIKQVKHYSNEQNSK